MELFHNFKNNKGFKMIIENSVVKAETNSSTKVACKIEANSVMFELLSARLYQDKALAVVRELSTNALDAQVEKGNGDIPFLVHLPTQFEPFFSIRDYGTGMTDEVVMELYSTMGSSSKRESNLFNGALGVGSKAPFAYTQGGAFTLSSFVEGVKSIYSVFSDGGVPSIALLGKFDTDEGNGVEISVPVNTSDIETFKTRATRVYTWFEVKPITNVTLTYPELGKPMFKGKDWEIHTTGLPSVVVMANVAYPIEASSNNLSLLGTSGLVIYAKTGEIQMAGSREGISYTKETLAKLSEWETEIRQILVSQLEDMLNGSTSYIEVVKVLNTLPRDIIEIFRKVSSPKFIQFNYRGADINGGDSIYFRRAREWGKQDYRGNTVGHQCFEDSAIYFVEDTTNAANLLFHHYKGRGLYNVCGLYPTARDASSKEMFNNEILEFSDKLKITIPNASDLAKNLGLITPKARLSRVKGATPIVAKKQVAVKKYIPNVAKVHSDNTEYMELKKTDRIKNLVIIPSFKGEVCSKDYTNQTYKNADNLVARLQNCLVCIGYKEEVTFCIVPKSLEELVDCGTQYEEFFNQKFKGKKFLSTHSTVQHFCEGVTGRLNAYLDLILPIELRKAITYMDESSRTYSEYTEQHAVDIMQSIGVLGVSVEQIEIDSKIKKELEKYDMMFSMSTRTSRAKKRCQQLVDLISKTSKN